MTSAGKNVLINLDLNWTHEQKHVYPTVWRDLLMSLCLSLIDLHRCLRREVACNKSGLLLLFLLNIIDDSSCLQGDSSVNLIKKIFLQSEQNFQFKTL